MWSFSGMILLLLHQGYATVPVAVVELGETGTFTCPLPNTELSNTKVKWYKQSSGRTLTLIVSLMMSTSNPKYEKGFLSSRFPLNYTTTMSTLSILETVPEDEAMYHCAITTWTLGLWTAAYLSFKDAVAPVTVVQLGKTGTFSCPFPKTELTNAKVKWYKQSSGHTLVLIASLMISTSIPKYEEGFPSSRFKVGHTTTMSTLEILQTVPEDEAMYHCQITTWTVDHWTATYLSFKDPSCQTPFCNNCERSKAGWPNQRPLEQVLVGSTNETKAEVDLPSSDSKTNIIILCLLCAILVICVIIMALLMYGIKNNKCDVCRDKDVVTLQKNVSKTKSKGAKDTWIYSTVIFTIVNTDSSGPRLENEADREKIFSAV